jgi:bifunctional non-homologous end joining protein LigD
MPSQKGLFLFVVHKHKATSLHYDFRLQIGDTMPSWSVPKGPTLDNAFKRLAMHVDDHDLSYRNFEGIIPEGQYGAGPVMIWDEGTYNPEIEISKGVRKEITEKDQAEKVLREELEKGELKFILYGKKLKGSFALVKTHGFGSSKRDTWLLIKHKDEHVKTGYDAKDFDFSVRTKRSLEEIATDPKSKIYGK